MFTICLFLPVLSKGSCSSGGFACGHRPGLEPTALLFEAPPLERIPRWRWQPSTCPIPRLTPPPSVLSANTLPAPAATLLGSPLTRQSSSGADRAFEVGCESALQLRSRWGEGLVVEMIM